VEDVRRAGILQAPVPHLRVGQARTTAAPNGPPDPDPAARLLDHPGRHRVEMRGVDQDEAAGGPQRLVGVGRDRMLPVRMEFETAFGTVRGYLAELRGDGVHLHLMRE